MENIQQRKKVFTNKKIITVLLIIALATLAISSLSYFFNYESVKILGKYVYSLQFDFPSIAELISFTFTISPLVLFFIYVIAFHEKNASKILIAITLGIISITYFAKVILSFSGRGYNSGYMYFDLFDFYDNDLYTFFSISDVLNYIAVHVFATLAVIGVFTKKLNKVFVILLSALLLVMQFPLFISALMLLGVNFAEEMYLYAVTNPAGVISSVAFYLAMLVFFISNNLNEETQKNEISKELKKALKNLDAVYSTGIISQEEYQQKKQQLIEKL